MINMFWYKKCLQQGFAQVKNPKKMKMDGGKVETISLLRESIGYFCILPIVD
jgi:hypothetical protein